MGDWTFYAYLLPLTHTDIADMRNEIAALAATSKYVDEARKSPLLANQYVLNEN